jgi:hypothetical protein
MSDSLRWFKGNMHMHSFWSDGHDFPEVIADWYKQRGYHFIAFTEHNQLQEGDRWVRCDPQSDEGRSIERGDLLNEYIARFGEDWVARRERDGVTEVKLQPVSEYRHLLEEPGRFLLIYGEEITSGWGAGTLEETHWINTFNLPEAIPPQYAPTSVTAMDQTLRRCRELAARSGRPLLVSLNHPNWRWNATAEDIAAGPLEFMEIHTALNSCRNTGDCLHACAERIWDIVLTLRLGRMNRPPVFGLVTDDAHAYTPDHHLLNNWALPGRAWMVVRSASLTPAAILASIQRGDFYGSTGVTLSDLDVDGRAIRLSIEPQEGSTYITRFIGTRRGCDTASEPVCDADATVMRTTRRYSEEVGLVLATQSGIHAAYHFAGDELYVRAVVTSDTPHSNPSHEGQLQQAWVQPAIPSTHRAMS